MIRRVATWIHRRIAPVHFARSVGVQVGNGCRLINVSLGSEPWLIKLGDHVSASDVSFITHDGGVWVFRDELPDIELLAPIVIGNNVFIGSGTIILPGVSIGDNVVIAAGAVVSRDVPAECVAAGVPAKPVSPLNDYRARVLEKAEHTRYLAPKKKRDHYEQKYRWLRR